MKTKLRNECVGRLRRAIRRASRVLLPATLPGLYESFRTEIELSGRAMMRSLRPLGTFDTRSSERLGELSYGVISNTVPYP